MLGCGIERTAEVVEDRQQLLHEPLVRTREHRRLLARAALAEVVELRREPLQPVEQLVALGLEGGNVNRAALLDLRLFSLSLLLRYLLVRHALGASCSSSITS
jgi:hypothetical protein